MGLVHNLQKPFRRPASAPTSRVAIVLAALAALAAFGVLLLLVAVGPRGVPGVDYYKVNVEFEDAVQITPLTEVRMLGRRVGTVNLIGIRNGRPTLLLQLLPGEGPIRSDTTAEIRLKSVLGGRYVELTPGRRGRPVPDGGTLPIGQTSIRTEILDVFKILDEQRRERFQEAARGLGYGFLGRGKDANYTLGAAPGLLRDVRELSESILRREGAAERFFPSAESLARAFDPVREELARGFRPEARVLGVFAERRADLEATLTEAPPALGALREGLDASVPLLDETARLARATTQLTDPAPAALRETNRLLREAQPALRDTRPLLTAAGNAVPPTLSLLESVDPVIEPAVRGLRSSQPLLAEFSSRGCDYLAFGRNWRSGLGYGVPPESTGGDSSLANTQPGVGNVLNSFRVTAKTPASLQSLAADNPPEDEPDRRANPYPEPCEAATEKLR